MPSYNKSILVGHLTRDVELTTTQGGTVIGKTGIAVNRKWKDKQDVMFIDLVAFGKQAETLSQHVGKGSALLVGGRIQLEQWESKDGQRRSKHSIVVEDFTFLGRKDDQQQPAKAPPASGPTSPSESDPGYVVDPETGHTIPF
jgi:single-strand DNA-binding protein